MTSGDMVPLSSLSPNQTLQAAATVGDPATMIVYSPRNSSSHIMHNSTDRSSFLQTSCQLCCEGAIVTCGDPVTPSILSPPISFSAAATVGDPAAPVFHSPQFSLDHAQLFAKAARVWPAFNDLRSAASAPKIARLRTALGALVSEARVIFGAALLSARGFHGVSLSPARGAAHVVHAWACYILRDGLSSFGTLWFWSPSQIALLAAHLSQLVQPRPWTCPVASCHPFMVNLINWHEPARDYPALFCVFFHALAAGCPWDIAFQAFRALPPGYFSADGRLFATAAFRADPHCSLLRFQLSLPDSSDSLTLFFSNSQVLAIACSHSVFPKPHHVHARRMVVSSRPDRGLFSSRLMPDYIRLKRDKHGWPIQPAGWVTSIVQARDAWHSLLGPLDAVTAAIVDGQLVMPKPSFPMHGSWRSNHPSWERNREAQQALGPKLAAWIAQGIVEVVPPWCPPPLFVEPLGAVDKATDPFWRLILDARISNEYHDEWGVWYLSISALAALLDECDILFAEDLIDAYHLSVFAGCTGRLRWVDMLVFGPDGTLIWEKRLVLGCDPSSCWGFCDKAMSGFSVEGFLMRFAAAHFGQRNAGSPLNAFMRTVLRFLASRDTHPSKKPAFTKRARADPAAEVTSTTFAPAAPSAVVATLRVAAPSDDLPSSRRGLGPEAMHSAVWVDDTAFVTKTAKHPKCAGLVGGCPVCQSAQRRAFRNQAYWHRLAAKLGLGLSSEKRQFPCQRATYTGLVIDTFLKTLSIPDDKKRKLAAYLESFFNRREASLTDLASLRGRIQHYSVCLPYTLPFVAFFSSVIGSEDDPDYDRVINLPAAVSDAAVFLRGVLEEHAFSGVPLWPFVPSTLYAAFLAGETGRAPVVVITWDASHFGWGMVLLWCDNLEGKVVVGSLPDTPDMLHQVRRETLAGCLAFEAAENILDLRDATIILRNDAVGALTAFRKGGFSSTFLQQCSMRMCHRQRPLRCSPLYLHAPGRVLIDEGVDDASRSLAQEVSGPTSGAFLRDKILAEARCCGWHITVDAFASQENTLVPRFFARFAEPMAEAEDAFTVGDWACSFCPCCHNWHREVLFAYPPTRLIPRFIAKARADGILAVVVVPLAVSAPYWVRLLKASISKDPKGFTAIRKQQHADANSDAAGNLAIFPVDFWGEKSRLRGDLCVPRCGSEGLYRGRPSLGSIPDQADRARILSELRSTLRQRDV